MHEPAGIPRLSAGDVIVSRATGERAIVLLGSHESPDGRLALHVFVRPGGAEVAEHVHPGLGERLRVIHGRVGLRLDGMDAVLEPGADVTIPAGAPHRRWNAGPDEAQLLVEVDRGRRFELMACTLFGLGNDRLSGRRGLPRLLQRAVILREFAEVIELAQRPRALWRLLYALLAPIGQALGYQPHYPRYLRPHGSAQPDPAVLELLGRAHDRAAAAVVAA